MACALLLSASYLGWQAWPSDPDLLRVATRICPDSAAGQVSVTQRSVWDSSGTVLETQWARARSAAPVLDVRLLDLRRNATRELSPALRAELQRGGGFPGPSPNRKWGIVWRRQGRFVFVIAVRLNGGATIRWPRIPVRGLRGVGWMPQSTSFVVVYPNEVVRLHVDPPGTAERIAITKLPDGSYATEFLHDGPLLFPLRAWSKPRNTIQAYLVSANRTPPQLRSLSIRLPAPRMVESVYASPQGDRLLWCLRTPPMPDWLDSVMRPFRRRAQWLRREVWASRADGTGMRELGASNGHGFYVTGWTPDGRHLTFVHDRFLYVAPVGD